MNFRKLLRDAVSHFAKRGFTSAGDVNDWMVRLNAAAETHLDSDRARARIERALSGAFYRQLGRGKLKTRKGKVDTVSMARLEPKLRDELERRMFAAREAVDGAHREALERIHARFLGIATAGASPTAAAISENVKSIDKAARDAKARQRMTAIDQTNKLTRLMDEVVAKDGGSIGGVWDATWEIERKHRPEHAARHGKFYVRRGTWADNEGMLRHPDGYMDESDMPGVLINCRCEYAYVYDLSDVPPQMLTARGRKAV